MNVFHLPHREAQVKTEEAEDCLSEGRASSAGAVFTEHRRAPEGCGSWAAFSLVTFFSL
ncbi:hypothetical protein GP5015_2134 [gamma proteobacterium HTCC5015]|nr:hypothetical protein GP5015_2134 [gamma proteobacterium HTCC5015]